MITTIQQWGNSLGLRIPISFAKDLHIHKSSKVDLAIEHGQMVIKPVRSVKYRLSSLVGKIKPQNLHSEADTGSKTGREAW